MREVIKTAPTVEEAIELALTELGLDRDAVSAEVLEYPEKKFFFKKPAKVRVYAIDDGFDLSDIFAREEKKEEAPVIKEEKAEKAPKPKKENKPKAEKAEKVVSEEVIVTEIITEEVQRPEEEISNEKTAYAMDFLKGIISEFGIENYTMRAVKKEGGFVIKIEGEGLGALIGRKGETMEALSYLTGLAANRTDEGFDKISVDVAGYRKKREKDIEASARKAARRVAKTGRSFAFEPMNPYERRLVHSAVSKVEGVRSESKGEGNSRRVVIYSLSPRPKGDRGGRGRGRNDRRGGRGPREKARPQAQKTREEKLVDFADFGLYGKIDLGEE